MELELDLASERRLYEAGIRPSAEIGLLLLSRLEQAEQAVQRVREVASEYRPSIPEEVLHEVMKDILRALDGDGRG